MMLKMVKNNFQLQKKLEKNWNFSKFVITSNMFIDIVLDGGNTTSESSIETWSKEILKNMK